MKDDKKLKKLGDLSGLFMIDFFIWAHKNRKKELKRLTDEYKLVNDSIIDKMKKVLDD